LFSNIQEITSLSEKWKRLISQDAIEIPDFYNKNEIESWINQLKKWKKIYRSSMQYHEKRE